MLVHLAIHADTACAQIIRRLRDGGTGQAIKCFRSLRLQILVFSSTLTRPLRFMIGKCKQPGKQITVKMHGGARNYSPPMHIYRITLYKPNEKQPNTV